MQAKNKPVGTKKAKTGAIGAKTAKHAYIPGMGTLHAPKIRPFFKLAFQQMLHRTGRKQAEICASLGWSSAFVSQIANGRRNTGLETWMQIAHFFGLTIEQFVHFARLLNEGVSPDIAYNTATERTAPETSSSQIDGVFNEIRTYWLNEKGDSPKSILALSDRFPEVRKWADAKIIRLKQSAEASGLSQTRANHELSEMRRFPRQTALQQNKS